MHTGDYYGLYEWKFFSKKGVLGEPAKPTSFFLRLYEELTEYFKFPQEN